MRVISAQLFLLLLLPSIALTQVSARDSARALTVDSAPRGAVVALDGIFIGTTPVQINLPPRGQHALLLKREFYADVRDTFRVLDLRSGITKLYKLRYPGTLRVSSDPPGASVFVDDSLRGKTPLEVQRISPGSRHLRLELEDYRIWRNSLVIPDSNVAEISIPLVSKFSYISIVAQSSDHTISINGVVVGTGEVHDFAVEAGAVVVSVVDPRSGAMAAQTFPAAPGDRIGFGSRLRDTTLRAVALSALAPGLGQYLHGSTAEGLGLLVVSAGSLIVGVNAVASVSSLTKDYNAVRTSYRNESSSETKILEYREKMLSTYQSLKDKKSLRNAAFGVFAATWCVSVVEAYLFHRETNAILELDRRPAPTTSIGFNITPIPWGARFAISLTLINAEYR